MQNLLEPNEHDRQPTAASAAPTWQAPTFTEVKMDAEIGSYQTDFDFDER